jgi:agmatine/peptidylarginine deiminase
MADPVPRLHPGCCPQYECSSRNVEILENTTDAKGRKLQVVKVPCPPPMFRTYHEADTMDVSDTAQHHWHVSVVRYI